MITVDLRTYSKMEILNSRLNATICVEIVPFEDIKANAQTPTYTARANILAVKGGTVSEKKLDILITATTYSDDIKTGPIIKEYFNDIGLVADIAFVRKANETIDPIFNLVIDVNPIEGCYHFGVDTMASLKNTMLSISTTLDSINREDIVYGNPEESLYDALVVVVQRYELLVSSQPYRGDIVPN